MQPQRGVAAATWIRSRAATVSRLFASRRAARLFASPRLLAPPPVGPNNAGPVNNADAEPVGGAGRSLYGPVDMQGDVTLGDPLGPSVLSAHAALAGATPVSMAGTLSLPPFLCLLFSFSLSLSLSLSRSLSLALSLLVFVLPRYSLEYEYEVEGRLSMST